MDINFFEELNGNKFDKSNIFLISILSLVVAGLFCITIFNQVKIYNLNNEIKKRVSIIENPASSEKIVEIRELVRDLEASEREAEELTALDNSICDRAVISEEVLNHIRPDISRKIVLSSINYYEDTIEISGTGASPNKIAQYRERVEAADYIESVTISNISLNDRYYNFHMDLKLKGDNIEIFN